MDSFYQAFSTIGGITREQIEADTSSLLPIWFVLRPFLERWFDAHCTLAKWQRELLRGVMNYEEARLRFVNSDTVMLDGAAASGDNWAAFVSNVDIEAVFEAIHNRAPLTPEHVRGTGVVLVCYGSNSYRAYATEVSRISELSLHPGIFTRKPSAFSNSHSA